MKITILDADTLGKDSDLTVFEKYGTLSVFQTTDPDETIDHIGNSDIVITNKVVINKEVLDACPAIKLICIAATGMNNVDLEYAKEKKIRVTNVAGYSTKSVAQHTFAMAFYLLEKLRYYDDYVKSGQWEKDKLFTHVEKPFFEIAGKKWGIIGLGTIGKEVANIASAFGAQVVYYSTSGSNENPDYEQTDLTTLMQNCDIISIHAPLNARTKNLITARQLQLMKQEAVLINVGRGGIIDEDALAEAIDTQTIYAGLDVTSKEPLRGDCALFHVKNKDRLLITPHIAWTSTQARHALLEGIGRNINDYLRDHTL